MTAPADVLRALEGRSIAIGGCDQATEIFAALRDVNARPEIVSGGSLARFDAAVIGPRALDRFSIDETPVLLAGPIDAGEAKHDFIIAPPLNRDELFVRLFRVLAPRSARGEAAATPTPVVVAADDDPTTTAIVRAVVSQAGMTCHVAPNGKRALELARELTPSAMVLDVNMPFLDGFEVLSALRGDPRTAAIPVIMLTSVQQEPDILRGFTLGADDYVAKPFNPMELLARVKRLVRRA